MLHSNHRRILLGLGAIAAFALPAVPAQAQVSASVSSGANVRWVGGDADNNVRFTLSGSSIIVDDVVPLAIGTGCAPVAGDPTKANCVAPKAGNDFKDVVALAGLGNDRVVNSSGVPMQGNGGPGNDTLIGDLKAKDMLTGSSGNDELHGLGGFNELDGGTGDDQLLGGVSPDKMKGGFGNDQLDGGGSDDVLDGGFGSDVIDGGAAGISVNERHDRVLYGDRSARVVVDLTRFDATQGEVGEADTIREIEDVVTGNGGDSILGNEFANSIDAGAGNDSVHGRDGRDQIVGGLGSDFLLPSSPPNLVIPFGAVPDGDVDVVDCGAIGPNPADPGDVGFRVLSDGDLIHDCATVFNQ
ncbi:calcium-binding protein [Solirubrobacter deserti]|uniref:calcium-binding protein n=1 Tax=Solirubrobacter deserti TaxID=2282478 RepID=UPI0022CD3E35|nr:calcium-binding protein [Solirubrobacter deserti]